MAAERLVWFDQSLPFRRSSGRREILPIVKLTDDYATDPIVAVETGHWFTDTGFFFLLRDLVQIAMPPADAKRWLARLLTPPSPDELRQALEPYAEAFDLVHPDYPAMQVRPTAAARTVKPNKTKRPKREPDLSDEDDDEEPEPAGAQSLFRLFPDVPTINNETTGKSFFNRLGEARPAIAAGLTLPLLYANMVLFPSPGAGRGQRGLPSGVDSIKFSVVGDTLWSSLWANILSAEGGPQPADERTFPWLDPRWRERKLGEDEWFEEEGNRVIKPVGTQIPMQRRHLFGPAMPAPCYVSGVGGPTFAAFERWPDGPIHPTAEFIPAWASVCISTKKNAQFLTYDYKRVGRPLRFDDWLGVGLSTPGKGWSVPDTIQRFTIHRDSILDALERAGELPSAVSSTAFHELSFRIRAIALIVEGKTPAASSMRELPLWNTSSGRMAKIGETVAAVIEKLDKIAKLLAGAAKKAVALTEKMKVKKIDRALADSLKTAIDAIILDLPRQLVLAKNDADSAAACDAVATSAVQAAQELFDETFPITGVDKASIAILKERRKFRGNLAKDNTPAAKRLRKPRPENAA